MAPTITKKKIVCSMIIALCIKKKKKKRMWCKDWLSERNVDESHAAIQHELQDGHKADFRNYLSMSINTFYILLAKVEPYIMKKRHKHEKQPNSKSSFGSNTGIF